MNGYCDSCGHPPGYHGPDGCSMPVDPGTKIPFTSRVMGARSERCGCYGTKEMAAHEDAVRAAREALHNARYAVPFEPYDAAEVAVGASAPHILAAERARIARAIRTDCRHGLMYAQGWYIGCPPCAACNDAAYIAEEDR